MAFPLYVVVLSIIGLDFFKKMRNSSEVVVRDISIKEVFLA